jgi:TonB family protein
MLTMRLPLVTLALASVCAISTYAQDAKRPFAPLPSDPLEILKAAYPLYDLTGSDMKPWHLKATYQLYDENGKPSEKGVYEYWWASAEVHRSSWTRPGASRTVWETGDGKRLIESSGQVLKMFEATPHVDWLMPLPDPAKIDLTKRKPVRVDLSLNGSKFPCVEIVPVSEARSVSKDSNESAYCFSPSMPVVRYTDTYGGITTLFNDIVTFRGRVIAKQMLVGSEGRNIFSAHVEEVNSIADDDPMLTPSPDAHAAGAQPVEFRGDGPHVLTKVAPTYPAAAEALHEHGVVYVRVHVDQTGRVKSAEALVSPSRALSASAVEAAMQWKFEPLLRVDGTPAEFDTTIHMIFNR